VTPAARSWSPKVEIAALAWVLAVVIAVVAVFTDDRPGRLLLGLVAVVLAAAGLFTTVVRPRLAADSEGVTVRGITGRKRWRWAEVNVRLAVTRRLGREVATVELDAENAAEPDLVVLGWFDLGTDPRDVVESLLELRT
jgi:apolipoprotein N-acyltransferase